MAIAAAAASVVTLLLAARRHHSENRPAGIKNAPTPAEEPRPHDN